MKRLREMVTVSSQAHELHVTSNGDAPGLRKIIFLEFLRERNQVAAVPVRSSS